MQLVWAERSYPITGGFFASVIFHVLLALLIILGVPSFFEVEILPAPQGIEATIVSDITAAPKVDKEGKAPDKPKPPTPPAPEQKKPEPPKPATPATPTQSSPPPAAVPEKEVAIPDETKKKQEEDKKAEEPKPEEKKVEKKPEEKPKPKTEQDQDFNKLLNDLTKNQPAPETKEKTKPKAKPAPAEPTVGPQTALLTEGPPMTAAEEDGIRRQVEPNWNLDVGSITDPKEFIVMVRVYFDADGNVIQVEFLDKGRYYSDGRYKSVADSCARAFFITKHVNFPSGKVQPTIRFVCDPSALL